MPTIELDTAAAIELQPEPIPASWILTGSPMARGKKFAESDDFTSCLMVWDCSPGKFSWHYNKDEWLVVLSGEVFISNGNGAEWRLGPGDWGFFPAGTSALWRVTSHLRKVAIVRETMPRPLGLALRLWKGGLRKLGIAGSLHEYRRSICRIARGAIGGAAPSAARWPDSSTLEDRSSS